MAPSGPTVMSAAKALGVGIGYSSMCPLVVMRPIWLPWISVNQSAPSYLSALGYPGTESLVGALTASCCQASTGTSTPSPRAAGGGAAVAP